MAISFVGSMAPLTAINGGNVTLTFTGASGLKTESNTDATLQENDLVIVFYETSAGSDSPMSTSSSGWTEITEMFRSGGTSTNFAAYYKVMSSSPDTSFVAVGDGGTNEGVIATAFAFRGVDPVTPFDVPFQSTSGTATGRPNPIAITPISPGAWIVVGGAGGAATGAAYTVPANLSSGTNHFRTTSVVEGNDGMLGVGFSSSWVSGSFDPDQFGGGTTGAGDSWAAITLALRPAIMGYSFGFILR